MTKEQMAGIAIEAKNCNEYCSSLTSCGECLLASSEQCGWCAGDSKCISIDDPNPSCSSNALELMKDGVMHKTDLVTKSTSATPGTCSCDCSAKTTCGSCASFAGCVWCDGSCKPGIDDVRGKKRRFFTYIAHPRTLWVALSVALSHTRTVHFTAVTVR